MKRVTQRGLTFPELLLVIVIIALLAAIAVPNLLKSRTMSLYSSCLTNLKNIRAAVNLWSIDSGAATTETPTTEMLVPAYIQCWPEENGVAYPTPSVGGKPLCPNRDRYPDHRIE